MTESDLRNQRIKQLVNDYVGRKQAGQIVSIDQIVSANLDIEEELRRELRRADLLLDAFEKVERVPEFEMRDKTQQLDDGHTIGNKQPSDRLQVRCPECQSSMDVCADTPWTNITCSNCKATFSLVHDDNALKEGGLTEIRQFKLVKRVGMGGYGTVWQARDTELDRVVAIKLPRRGQLSAIQAEQFLREARACAQIQHPNIVRVYEVGHHDEHYFIASEFIDGRTLEQELSEQRPTIPDSVALIRTISDALHCAHESGIVHRDLKPGNILIDSRGEPHITDFGLAKRDVGDITMTMDGAVLGTPAYMSPEQAAGSAHTADARSDIYSLGVILFRMVTGELPFRGSTAMILSQVIHDDPPRLRRLNNRVPQDLETICLKCLEKSSEKRFNSAYEVYEELGRVQNGLPILSRPISRVGRIGRWAERKPMAAALLSTLLVVLTLSTIVSGYLAAKASESAAKASEQLRLADLRYRRVYAAEMNRVQRAMDDRDNSTARAILESFRPVDGEIDQRSFEWNYWFRKCTDHQVASYQGKSPGYAVDWSADGAHLVWGNGDGQVYISGPGLERPRRFPDQHLEMINSIDISQDNRTVVTGSDDGTIKFWDVATGKSKKSWDVGGVVWQVQYWHDDRSLIFVVENIQEERDEVLIRDIESGQMKHRIRLDPQQSWYKLELAGDDFHFCVVSDYGLEVYRIDMDQPLWNKKDLNDVGMAVFLDDDSSLAMIAKSRHEQDLLITYDFKSGKVKQRTELDFRLIHAARMEFLHRNNQIALGTGSGTVVILDAENGKHVQTLTGHRNRILGLSVSPDGRKLASVGDDATVRIWNLEVHSNPRLISTGEQSINQLGFSPDGKELLSSAYKMDAIRICRWRLDILQQIEAVTVDLIGGCTAFSADGSLALIGGERLDFSTSDLYLWSRGSEPNLIQSCSKGIWAVCFSSDKTQIGFGENLFPKTEEFPGDPVSYRIFPVHRPTDEICLGEGGRENGSGHRSVVKAAVFSPDGRHIVTAGRERTVKLWDVRSRQMIYSKQLQGTTHVVRTLAISPDGEWLATGSSNGTVQVRKCLSGEIYREFQHTDDVSTVLFMEHGKTLATGSFDNSVRLWDIETGQLRTAFITEKAVSSLAVSPDDAKIAAGLVGGDILIWDGRPLD